MKDVVSDQEKIEKLLYKDRQSDCISKVGAATSYFADRLLNHRPVEFLGLKKLKLAEPSLIAPTHQSSSDIPLMGWAALKAGLRPPSFIAKVGLMEDRKIIGRILPRTGAYYIEQSKRDIPYLQQHVSAKISSGRSVVMFPEGTRRAENHSIKLERGLGILAVQHAIDVTPVGIYAPSRNKYSGKSPTAVVVGDTISADRNPIKFRNELTETLVDLYQEAKGLIHN